MGIEEILDVIDELLDKSWNLPLTGGRCVVDAEKVRDLIDDVRLNLPTEIKQARAIVSDRNEIIAIAKRESETLIRKAEERARVMVSQEEVVREAQARAKEIVGQAQRQAREMRAGAQKFSDEQLQQTEAALLKSLEEVKGTRQALRTAMHNQSGIRVQP